MTKAKSKYKIIYKMDYAMELIARGHTVSGTSPNPKKPLLTMWIFENSDSLEADLSQLIEADDNYGR